VSAGAEDRLRRLLAMLPWLMERGEVPLAEVARRFEVTEAAVVRDLELVAMCGLPPYVDEMIDVFVDEGTVFVGVPRLFLRPLRLTAPEAFALLAAVRTALELPGVDQEGPLARGVAKLSAAVAADDTAAVVVDLDRPALLDALVEHVARRDVLEIAYYTPSRDEVTERTVVPRHVHTDGGNWYLVADDDRSGSTRNFRVDRIESVQPTGDVAAAMGPPTIPAFFDDDLPSVTLRLSPLAGWVIEQYPGVEVGAVGDDGWTEVQLTVASERWLDRLLLRLGPEAVVVDAPDAVDRVRSLAERLLAAYGA
jgi:proteasome accessory factor C